MKYVVVIFCIDIFLKTLKIRNKNEENDEIIKHMGEDIINVYLKPRQKCMIYLKYVSWPPESKVTIQ